MSISVKDVEYLAHLARIQLSTDEVQRFAGQLDEILAHVEKLKSVNTEGVPPTSHVLSLTNVFREDRARPSLKTDEALANAPDKEGPFFRVPKIIEAT
ncbi:MAG: Asp-tRNA(Asn)/Glu-tRNA(Gln) amidotransferase subunit GatC [Candidatus Omnitrophica bacterium]|nr:Asp-tRNA(Asn)/Glu-tRNA(Gln) amidotransferase subunit GatC [Candidatus Omnitrophota bacterium]